MTVDGRTVVTRGGNAFTRRFGAGYPSEASVIEILTPILKDAGS